MEFAVNRVRPAETKVINYYQLSAHTEEIVKSFLLFSTRATTSFTLAFYGFLRTSEYTTLHWSNVTLTAEKLSITLHQSKIDPFRCGHTIHLHSTNSSTCPLPAFHLYSNLMRNKLPSALVFSAETFSPLIHCLLQQAGLNQSDYASYSFRIGATTTAAAAGLPTLLIKKLGRWTSNAYRSYIHCPATITSSVPKILSRADASNQANMECR